MKPIRKDIFRTYDIRGVVDEDLDLQWVRALGRTLGAFYAKRKLKRSVVGLDCRHSSAGYEKELVRGMAESGMDVIRMGLASTPMFYYAVKSLNVKAGVMITASHNPPEYNGFKIWLQDRAAYGKDIAEIYEIMANMEEVEPSAGVVSDVDMTESYLGYLGGILRLRSPLKIVVDGGNGMGGEITARLLEKMGVEVVRLYCEPDGSFPNHHPDPVVEDNISDLKTAVVREKAHLGIGLDGDGDRISVVDETGRMLYGDELLAILARRALIDEPGMLVLGDVKCSYRLFDDIAAHGGKPLMSATGHSLMKARMRETGAGLGGEISGHMFFNHRFYGVDDATYAAGRIAEIVSENPDKPLSAYLSDWPNTLVTPEKRVFCPEDLKDEVVEAVRERLEKDGYSINLTDGVRLDIGGGWALVRRSNTQPALTMRFEAEDEGKLEELRSLVEYPVMDMISKGQTT